jgi:hypothetical protein
LVERTLERPLDGRGNGEVVDLQARRADEVVVLAEHVLGELEAGMLAHV